VQQDQVRDPSPTTRAVSIRCRMFSVMSALGQTENNSVRANVSGFPLIVLQKSFCGMGLKFSEAWARRLNNDVGDHVATRQTHRRFWQRVCGSIERRLSLVSFFGGNLAAAAFGLLQHYRGRSRRPAARPRFPSLTQSGPSARGSADHLPRRERAPKPGRGSLSWNLCWIRVRE